MSLIIAEYIITIKLIKRMTLQTKPVHQYFKQLRYKKHKYTLATIESQKPQPQAFNLLESVHKIRSQSITFHHIEQENQINTKNQKLLQKLLSISKRKSSEYSQINYPKMITYNNPARKKREKMITEMNQQMAERMLNKQSDYKTMRKSIQQYERVKRTMSNNRRALSNNFVPGLPSMRLNKSKVQMVKEKPITVPITIKYQECQEDNPEFIMKTQQSF